MKIFRNSRKAIMGKSNTGKYLKYAIGEILLVMIGILLALQVNNWNSNRVENLELKANYERMHEELVFSSKQMKGRANYIDTTLVKNSKRCLEILKQKNNDSLIELNKHLNAITGVTAIRFNLPVTSEFMKQGSISKIKNESLKKKFLVLENILQFSTTLQDYSRTQYHMLLEPFFSKHINYAQISNNPDLISINEVTDFSDLKNNLEFENILNLKLEVDAQKVEFLNDLAALIDDIDAEILIELDSK